MRRRDHAAGGKAVAQIRAVKRLRGKTVLRPESAGTQQMRDGLFQNVLRKPAAQKRREPKRQIVVDRSLTGLRTDREPPLAVPQGFNHLVDDPLGSAQKDLLRRLAHADARAEPGDRFQIEGQEGVEIRADLRHAEPVLRRVLPPGLEHSLISAEGALSGTEAEEILRPVDQPLQKPLLVLGGRRRSVDHAVLHQPDQRQAVDRRLHRGFAGHMLIAYRVADAAVDVLKLKAGAEDFPRKLRVMMEPDRLHRHLPSEGGLENAVDHLDHRPAVIVLPVRLHHHRPGLPQRLEPPRFEFLRQFGHDALAETAELLTDAFHARLIIRIILTLSGQRIGLIVGERGFGDALAVRNDLQSARAAAQRSPQRCDPQAAGPEIHIMAAVLILDRDGDLTAHPAWPRRNAQGKAVLAPCQHQPPFRNAEADVARRGLNDDLLGRGVQKTRQRHAVPHGLQLDLPEIVRLCEVDHRVFRAARVAKPEVALPEDVFRLQVVIGKAEVAPAPGIRRVQQINKLFHAYLLVFF